MTLPLGCFFLQIPWFNFVVEDRTESSLWRDVVAHITSFNWVCCSWVLCWFFGEDVSAYTTHTDTTYLGYWTPRSIGFAWDSTHLDNIPALNKERRCFPKAASQAWDWQKKWTANSVWNHLNSLRFFLCPSAPTIWTHIIYNILYIQSLRNLGGWLTMSPVQMGAYSQNAVEVDGALQWCLLVMFVGEPTKETRPLP